MEEEEGTRTRNMTWRCMTSVHALTSHSELVGNHEKYKRFQETGRCGDWYWSNGSLCIVYLARCIQQDSEKMHTMWVNDKCVCDAVSTCAQFKYSKYSNVPVLARNIIKYSVNSLSTLFTLFIPRTNNLLGLFCDFRNGWTVNDVNELVKSNKGIRQVWCFKALDETASKKTPTCMTALS